MMTGDYRYALVTCSPNTVETTNKAFRKGGFCSAYAGAGNGRSKSLSTDA